MLEDLLKQILSDVVGEEVGRTKQPIGIVKAETLKKYNDWREEKEELEAEMEFRMERIKRKLEKQLREEFETQFEEMSDKKDKLWQAIRAELNIIGDVSLNIDTKTGVISQWTKGPTRERH